MFIMSTLTLTRKENMTPIWLIPVIPVSLKWWDASGEVLKMFDSCCKAAVSETQQDSFMVFRSNWATAKQQRKLNLLQIIPYI